MCKPKRGSDGVEPISRSSESSRSRYPRSPGKAFPTTIPAAAASESCDFSIWSASFSTSAPSLSTFRRSFPPPTSLLFDFSEIRTSTNNFLSPTLSSSSSSAWRCSLRGRDAMVVQRKLRLPIDPFRLQKRLSLICRIHHANLARLAGAAVADGCIYLVYDCVHGLSLAECLRNPRNPSFSALSSWMSRIQVAADVAHGLDYLHNRALPESPLVHNRIKSSAIVLVAAGESLLLRAKICHVGAAELAGEVPDVDGGGCDPPLQNRSRILEGTRGYMSPELKNSATGSVGSDVFAFGVVMLELLSGEEPLRYEFDDAARCYRRISAIERAREAVDGGHGGDGGGGVRRWVDRRLRDSFPVEVALKLTRLALECVEEDPNRRPGMGRVAGKVSKLFLRSKIWSEKMRVTPGDQSSSFAPR